MASPHLYADSQDIARIRKNLAQYDWYRKAFENIQQACDAMLKKGFSVPDTCGFVFYNSCKSDNTPLIFDPFDRENHICPTCGMNYKDQPIQRAWECSYHQWLAQMSINLGISYAITGDESYARAIRRILMDYVRYYPGYENNDNELGTTKLFQSTYIESVWVSYLTCAFDLANSASCFSEEERRLIKKELFVPSAQIIYDYDEKRNNRQAFNNSGLCAVAITAEDDQLLEYALHGPHGFESHMKGSVLSDGLWYEGDNYHFATVPSLVNVAEMCLHNGIDLYHREFDGHSIKEMFEAPLKSLQPDLTFPSRKDSSYACQIAQRWYSGLYELAYTRYGEEAFGRILKVMYENPPKKETELKSAAGLMDIFTPQPALRSCLDWRGFLNLTPDLGKTEGLPVTVSVNMEGTGLAVLRQGKNNYLSMDYGDYGGGHGHPDRLSLTYFTRGRRWLTDYGTGQYYFDHLNWYRSTVGHNTVNADGAQHLPVSGSWEIFAETASSAVTRGKVQGLYPGVNARRTAAMLEEGLVFDRMEVISGQRHRYHNVYHSFGELELSCPSAPKELDGDAYRFLSEIEGGSEREDFLSVFHKPEASFLIRTIGEPDTGVYSAKAYGPPCDLPNRYPLLIQERFGNTVSFVNLMEDVPAGEESRVSKFSALSGESWSISLKNGDEIQIGSTENGLWICRYQSGKLQSFESFGLKEIPGVVRYTLPLKQAYGILRDGHFHMELPEDYGCCRLDPALYAEGETIVCNGAETANPAVQSGRIYSLLNTHTLFNGIPNRVSFLLGNFTNQTWETALDSEALHLPATLHLQDGAVASLKAGETGEYSLTLLPSLPEGETSCEGTLLCSGERWSFRLDDPVSTEEWVDYRCTDGKPLKVLVKNHVSAPLTVFLSFLGKSVELSGGEERVFGLSLNDPSVSTEKDKLLFDYTVKAGTMIRENRMTRSALSPEWLPRLIPLDSAPWNPNLIFDSISQISRGEKRWGGKEDLSAEGMMTVSGGTSLTLNLHITDDHVLFSGGKFPFDNDGIQIYFDRRTEDYRKVDYATEGVYGLLVRPGVFDETSTVAPITKWVKKPEEISVSVYTTQNGYNILMDIPFTSLGGIPGKGEVWGFDLVLNDRDRGVRRDMQMIWSGALPNERTYLREDHHDPMRFGLIRF